jgi:hypothetical protein
MTKVQTRFKVVRALTDSDLENISRVHTVYGIFAARLQASGDQLFIEYDASRLSLNEVREMLEQHGLPIE